MHEMVKPSLSLLAVTLVAAFLLGLVYTITEGPIAEQKAKTEAEAVARLIPGTISTEARDTAEGSAVTKETRCFNTDGKVIGFVLSASPKGYGGAIDIMVGYDPEGVIQGMQLISHTETPGLGANAALPKFSDQYKGKAGALTVTKGAPSGNEIEAIASATITTAAITGGVNETTAYFEAHLKAGVAP